MSKPRRPNLLFIMTDDQAAWSRGCMGGDDAHTPNLDALAGDGALLRKLFANAAVCSPRRT